jgi:hypothetical protein
MRVFAMVVLVVSEKWYRQRRHRHSIRPSSGIRQTRQYAQSGHRSPFGQRM